MNFKEYGGYLPLELPRKKKEYFYKKNDLDLLRVNSGRSAFFYSVKSQNIKTIYLPYFNCIETKDPFIDNKVKIKYYYLDENLLPKDIFLKENEYLLWTNYYGNASEKDIKNITSNFSNIIIDNCNAFFSKPIKNAYNCYSTRKFFGVSDGGYLIRENLNIKETLESDSSYDGFNHLIKQIELGTNQGYEDNLKNEKRISNKYLAMSKLTRYLLERINYNEIQDIRKNNLLRTHNNLKEFNKFEVNIESNTHLYYPLLIENDNLRNKLIEEKIYVPFLWQHILEELPKNTIEYYLAKYTILLPIDQRYTLDDIDNISYIVRSLIQRNS